MSEPTRTTGYMPYGEPWQETERRSAKDNKLYVRYDITKDDGTSEYRWFVLHDHNQTFHPVPVDVEIPEERGPEDITWLPAE